MRYLCFLIVFFSLLSCSSVHHSYWIDEKEETIATVVDAWWQDVIIVSISFETKDGQKVTSNSVYPSIFINLPKGAKFKAYYSPSDPKKMNVVDFTKPEFGDTQTSKTFCYVQPVPLSINKYRSSWQINYDILYKNKKYKSMSFFSHANHNRKDIAGYWFRVKYATSTPAFSQLQIDTPYTTKENTDLKFIDIGDKTTQKLNKAARKLKSGGTLYWTTSNIGLSDNAEINQEELTKMNQFLETYEPKGLLGRKLDVKVEIVDHRNIGEVLIPVDRGKLE